VNFTRLPASDTLATNLLWEVAKGGTLDQALNLRLARSYALLKLIDLRRAQTGDPGIGWAIQKRILDQELQDLEAAAVAGAPDGPTRAHHFRG
jgi:hypothetical protein